MDKLPITLAVFSSTKGHHGHKDIYQTTIKSLEKQIDLNKFGQKIAHIKKDEGENPIEMISFFKERGFEIVESVGSWKHFDLSHQQNYLLDIIKISKLIKESYVFHLEDDFLIEPKLNIPVAGLIEASMELLSSFPYHLTARFPADDNEVERINGLRAKHGLDAEVGENGETLFTHNDFYSHNPNITRAKDYYLAAKIVEENFEQLSFHSEKGYGKAMRWLSPEKYPLMCFKPTIAKAIHIGTQDFKKENHGI